LLIDMPELDRAEHDSPPIHVVMIDDSSLYSKKLVEGFTRLGTRCILYGPLSAVTSKSPGIMEPFGPYQVRVWSQHWFPLQILKRAVKDRPNIVHIQFEFY